MATLAEIKKQYPQYAGIPDKELADALYDKYYSKESKGDFYKAVGYSESWKEALGRGVDNLQKESKDPLTAVKNLGLGVLKGGSDIIDGSAQLLARGAAGASGYIAPGSTVDNFLQQELKNTEAYNQDREDRYQTETNGSVLAGVGRVGGNAVVPLSGASKVAQAATLPSKIVSGAKVGALSAATQPVYDMDQPGANYALDKGVQVATGVAAGGTIPILSRVGREAAAATGKVIDNPIARAAEDSLVGERGRNLFANSVNPGADAQIIKDLANLKADPLRFQQVVNGQAAVGRSNATGIGADYKDEVVNLMKQAGMKDEQILNILNKNVITSADIASLPNTPAGQAASSALTLAARADAMTKPGVSNSIMAPARWAARTFLPERPASAINTFLGGRTTGEANINSLTTPRNVAAADRVLANGSPVQAIDSFGQVARQTAAQNAAEAEARVAQESADLAGKPAREAQRAISDLQATDPTYILGLSNPNGVPRNSTQMKEFSDVLKAQMEAAAKKAATEKSEAQTGILNAVKDRAGVVNRSGPLRNLEEGFGMDSKAMDDTLKSLVEKNPELKDLVDSLYKSGTSLDRQALYDISDIIAATSGKKFVVGGPNQGILNQSSPGALYQGKNVTVEGIRNPVSYAANVKNAEEAVQIARDSAFSPELGQFATSVAGVKSPADKLALIQDRLSKATDLAEIDYINKFVLPLANFGKK